MTIEVLGGCSWSPTSGGTWAGSSGGTVGRLVKARLDGVVFYVRENLAGVDRFLMSSAARLSMKEGRNPKGSIQVLELCAPEAAWEKIAAAVREHDAELGPHPGRQVRRHRQFTVEWAEAELAKK